VPLYEYECAHCGRFEIIQKFSDQPLLTCPTCGRAVQKVLSAPAIQFKGTGWYITDYARKSTGKGESKGGESKGAQGADKGKEGGASSGSKQGPSKDGAPSSSDSATGVSKSGTSDAGSTSKRPAGGGRTDG
jgi:putative FmdB family regulatory protein